MARRKQPEAPVLVGDCTCWAHDHPHLAEYPWHHPSWLRFRATGPDTGAVVIPISQDQRRADLLDAGCTSCSDVAGGGFLAYLTRMGRT